MHTSPFTITNEQINSLPLLLGVLDTMGIRDVIDTHVHPHGHWTGASVGALVTIWLSCLLQEHDHRLVMVRDWADQRAHTINHLLGITLRPTDCTDDRLANVLTMLGDPATQATLDTALTQRWLRVYRLPTSTVRLDSTSVSVYHDPTDPDSLLQLGHSKDHRPDLRQFKVMLATLDPLGMPLACQVVPGQAADDPLYVPAYHAAIATVGTTDVLVVGDSKMAALDTRGTIVRGGSRYLCAYRPPNQPGVVAAWIDQALAHTDQWRQITDVNPATGEVLPQTDLYTTSQDRTWTDARGTITWTERVVLARSVAAQAGLQRRREQTMERLTTALLALGGPPKRGRKRYRSAEELAAVVTRLIGQAKLSGIVQVDLADAPVQGSARWVVQAVRVDPAAWQAMVDRLGWQIYLSNTTDAEYAAATLVAAYHDQVIHERGFARLKTRNLQLRPVYLRDETRMAGLVWLLCLALRVLTLTEYQVRSTLDERAEAVVGLNPASRTQATTRPTTERLLTAFANVTLTILTGSGGGYVHVTPLNATQQHILALLDLPPNLYERLTQPMTNWVPHLRE